MSSLIESDEQVEAFTHRYQELAQSGERLYPELADEFDLSTRSAQRLVRNLQSMGRLKPYNEYRKDVERQKPKRNFRRLFWDIETSPNIGLFWKASEKVWLRPDNVIQEKAIICICYKWEGEDKVHSLHWDDGDDRDMIAAFLEVATDADELVAHGGDFFDLKWFNTQCLQHGLDSLPEPKTVDTLVIARRRFYLNSNKLDYLAKLLLGEGKLSTGFGLWKKILLDNDPKALKKMVEYCKRDVELLERVYNKISMFHGAKTHVGVTEGLPKWTCAHCASEQVRRKKKRVTAKGTLQHTMVCKDCAKHYTISNRSYEDFLEEGSK